ncbi:hypothetical protein Vid5_gp60 [Pantoea phage vB_PagS_Vid5]|uniref:Uncharacterized protein n=1 Tax=Pantoea phage vB_PagS_Vid5 TaxID=2099652 RepID=A0A2P1CLA8_9CAUD|nr:hypothetical protein FDJ45_gp095 [Pantoea phage vB_PagS_Vid5]AVJ51815.1 hypothetical protein Vid5_gp60 [Pantoea phage vB_PagS_Vid5]
MTLNNFKSKMVVSDSRKANGEEEFGYAFGSYRIVEEFNEDTKEFGYKVGEEFFTDYDAAVSAAYDLYMTENVA